LAGFRLNLPAIRREISFREKIRDGCGFFRASGHGPPVGRG
jgi:hypothetical protein